MSQDSPSIEEILITLKEFADDVAARSEGAERYDALCAGFLAEFVRRELQLDADQNRWQEAALCQLTGSSGTVAALYRDFCRNVRDGQYDDDWQPAFDFALRQVIDKVRVTNPEHLEPDHRES